MTLILVDIDSEKVLFFDRCLFIFMVFFRIANVKISIHRGAVEPISVLRQDRPTIRGKNGMCDVDVWKPDFPDFNEIVHSVGAVEMIRDLIMQVE